jgi:predicted ribosomally synthesized peptide with nif11-like leader
MEQAKAFIKKMKTDEAFHDRIMAIEDADERMNAIPMEGFDCTKDDLNALFTACELAKGEYEHVEIRGGGSCPMYDVSVNTGGGGCTCLIGYCTTLT